MSYLKTEFLIDDPNKLDILEWWKGKRNRFSTLSLIARDILATPVSSVPSEQSFSASKRVLNPHRSRLRPDIMEGLICLKDWEDAKRQKQNIDEDTMAAYFASLDVDDVGASSLSASNIM